MSAGETDEKSLVEQAKRGDLNAMRPIFERYAPPLYGTVILPRIGNAPVAEDILRDTLATAVEKLHQFTWQGSSMYPWLRQIAVNKVFDFFRASKRARRLAEALAYEIPSETAPESAADALLIATQERQHHQARVRQTLDAMPARYRTALELRLIAELSREACAAQLSVTVSTFDVLLFRAVRSFRKHFGGSAEDTES